MIKNIQEEHEAVRAFVEQETGGFVEKIEGSSTSRYAPKLRSLSEEEAYEPLLYEITYTVDVVLPPDPAPPFRYRTERLVVVDCVDHFMISERATTLHRVVGKYWAYHGE